MEAPSNLSEGSQTANLSIHFVFEKNLMFTSQIFQLWGVT